jgi:hypothetical protein
MCYIQGLKFLGKNLTRTYLYSKNKKKFYGQ